MPRNYEYLEINMSDLILDDENPRFASSMLVKGSSNNVSQEQIIEHLLKYADIVKLANRINEVGELHGSEIVTCYKRGDKYVVLEGNRRTCACKLLLDRKLIPEEYKSNFPFIRQETKENIEQIIVTVYPDRKAVQAFLSDRHISGVKRWSALEKNNYYMNLFETYKDVKEVKKYTSDTLSTVVKSIKKYQFFMNVFSILNTKYKNIEIEKLDYLPMVDRFMETLVGSDDEVGLKLQLDDEKLIYRCKEDKKEVYNEILMRVGEAFLIRREKKFCTESEMSKIVASEIYSILDQKKLILDNIRIPGLMELINQYKNQEEKSETSASVLKQDDSSEKNDNSKQERESNTRDNTGEAGKGTQGEQKDAEEQESLGTEVGVYTPPIRYKPKKTKIEHLCFSQNEASNFKINTENAYDVKIRCILYDLGNFSVYRHPYTVALLYRTLLEISTKRVYFVAKNKIGREHNENNLVQSMLFITNNFLFNGKSGKDMPKIKEAIKNYLSSPDLIQILNLYIHYADSVDENIILSSWSSMKKYVQYCLEIN